MKPDILFENFDLLADAPNSVPKLREMILQLAVQGKLVPQNSNDESASELLKKVKAEKKKLILEGKLKKQKPLPPVPENEIPYKLPTGWEWCHLNEISNNIHYGYTASAKPNIQKVRLLRITDIQNGNVIWNNVPGCEIEDSKLEYYKLYGGDLLIARTGGTIGKTYLVNNVSDTAVFASYLIRVIPNGNTLPAYLKYFFMSPLYWEQLHDKSSGTGQPNVNATSLKSLLTPIPPLAEQKRIVDKVDQLMELCDELEKREEKAAKNCVRLNDSSIDRLLSPAKTKEFNKNWRRIADNFDLLYSKAENVGKLKQAILQLAVQGKLVPQNSNDESASVLLEKIKAEREKLIAEGKLKKQKSLPPVSKDDVPYKLPKGWEWVRLGDIIKISSGTNITSAKMAKDGKIPVYGGNGITGFHNKFNISSPTIVIGRVGFYCGCVHLTTEEAWITDNAFKTHFSEANLYRTFLVYLLRAVNLRQNYSATAQPVISGKKVYRIVVAIPPLNEQKRIVSKVDQLMELCEELESQLENSQKKAGNLLEAVTERIFAKK